VVLDAQWEGSPGTQIITEQLSSRILLTGWLKENFQVIVIDPELENWIWQRNENLAQFLRFENKNKLAEDPDVQRNWPQEKPKPEYPKELLETVLRKHNIRRSSALYRQITSKVSIKGCQDSAFLLLRDTLQRWFPADNNQSSGAAE
jgi:hypothetical protein